MKLIFALASATAVSAQAPLTDLTRAMAGGPWIFSVLSSMLEQSETATHLEKLYAQALYERAKYQTPPPAMYQAAMDVLIGDTGFRKLECTEDFCSVPVSLRPLFGYGCWCNLGNELLEGNGPPQDIYDEHCMKLQHCLRCVTREVEDKCHPATHAYSTSFLFNPLEMSLEGNCEDDNPGDDCGTGLCACEVRWIDRVLQTGFSGTGVDLTLNHAEGGFDRDEVCPRGEVDGSSEMLCCGRYPDRMMYNTAKNDCCVANDEHDGSIFNPITHCCVEAGVAENGSAECIV